MHTHIHTGTQICKYMYTNKSSATDNLAWGSIRFFDDGIPWVGLIILITFQPAEVDASSVRRYKPSLLHLLKSVKYPLLKSVKCYPGRRKINLISSISEILSQMCYH